MSPSMIKQALSRLARRVGLIVSRGVVRRVNDATTCQTMQVSLLADELRDDVERFEAYGVTSHPLVGAEVVFLSVGGNRAHGIVVAVTDRRSRPTGLAEGDVCLYTEHGERVYLNNADDVVHLGAKSAADFVALAAETNARLDALESFAASHTHSATGILDSTSGSCTGATAAAAGAPSGSSVAASKVKAT
jgi:phage baseplate assembly protein V